jgi:hypothetical protein
MGPGEQFSSAERAPDGLLNCPTPGFMAESGDYRAVAAEGGETGAKQGHRRQVEPDWASIPNPVGAFF